MTQECPQLLGQNVAEGVRDSVGVSRDLLETLGSNGPEDGISTPSDEKSIGHHLDDGSAGALGHAVVCLNVTLGCLQVRLRGIGAADPEQDPLRSSIGKWGLRATRKGGM